MKIDNKNIEAIIRLKYILILVFLSSAIYAQDKEKLYSLSGNIKLLVGTEKVNPAFATIEIKQLHKIEISDSIGNFNIENLKPGNYKLSVIGFGYQPFDTLIEIHNQSIENLDLLIPMDCDVNGIIAENDIKKGKPKLLLIGSIAPVIYPKQHEFEKKYKIRYYDYGDNISSQECIQQYNEVVFKYLDKTYGESWREEVRYDVIGFEENDKRHSINSKLEKLIGVWGEDEIGNAQFAFYVDSIYYPDPNLWCKYKVVNDTILIQRDNNWIEKVLILSVNEDSLKLNYLDYDDIEIYEKRK